jgi:toxin ParE1/3/4
MSRLTIDMTDHEHQSLKALAALQGKTIKQYVAKLKEGCACLAARQGSFKDMSALYPGLRIVQCQHHYVFCLLRENAPALIVAILHERMDLIARLFDRLR